VQIRQTKTQHKKFHRSGASGCQRLPAVPNLGKAVFGGARLHFLKKTIYQDNQSTIRFEKNGRRSCGPNSRHIDIRYFWIKDRLGIENIDVRYCPMAQMLADFFTKPLQGSLFRKLKAVIMGHMHVDSLLEFLKEVPPATAQERVGENMSSEFGENMSSEENGSGADVRRADARMTYTKVLRPVTGSSDPVKVVTYAEVAKRQSPRPRVRFESKRRKTVPPLTLKQ
jgi:hypothetical protein